VEYKRAKDLASNLIRENMFTDEMILEAVAWERRRVTALIEACIAYHRPYAELGESFDRGAWEILNRLLEDINSEEMT
jgi:hypothetical protein